jgi:beta-N-acetylhexosaminidase
VAWIVAACAPAASVIPTLPPTPEPTLPPTPVPTPSPAPTGTPAPTSAAALRGKIGRLLVVGFRGTTLPASSRFRQAIEAGELGGVVLFDRDQLTRTAGRNITSPTQLTALTDALRSAGLKGPLGASLIVSVDQEGGSVARLNPADGYPATESEAKLGATNDIAHTTDAATLMAITLAGAGIDLNLAPVVDLNVNPTNPAIGALGRSYSADPAIVTAQATAMIEAHHAAGIKCAIKHFPGEGSATGNTDFGVVDVSTTWTATELKPFRDLVAVGIPDIVMVGHIVNHQLDKDRPASLSKPTVTALLRDDIGWTGPIISDDMQATAITAKFGADEAIALALEAGVDLLLFANQQVYDGEIVAHAIATIEGLVTSGRITEARLDDSIARIEGLFAPIE